MRDDENEDNRTRDFGAVAIHKDIILATKANKVNFYNLNDGELLYTVHLKRDGTSQFANVGWAKMDSEKAVVGGNSEVFVIDLKKRALIGAIGKYLIW